MKKRLTAVVVIIILSVALFILNSRPRVAPTIINTSVPPSHSGRLVEIFLNQNGVSKNNLTVRTGDTVLFKNTDSALHWPASGTHPAHLGCPGFDAMRGLKQNESYSFTFEKAATCSFHDHLNARNTSYNGIITINEK